MQRIPTQPSTPKLTRSDKRFLGIVFVIALLISFFGAATGHLWLVGPGILLMPIALVLRFPRFPRKSQPEAGKPSTGFEVTD